MSRKVYNISNHWKCTLLRNKDRIKLLVNLDNPKQETYIDPDVKKRISGRSFKLRALNASRTYTDSETKNDEVPDADTEHTNKSNIMNKCSYSNTTRLGEHLGKRAFNNMVPALKSLEAEAINKTLCDCSPPKNHLHSEQVKVTEYDSDTLEKYVGNDEAKANERSLNSRLKDKKMIPSKTFKYSFLPKLYLQSVNTNSNDTDTFGKCEEENHNKVLELHSRKYYSSKMTLSKTLKEAAKKYVIKNSKPSSLVLEEHLHRWEELKRHRRELETRCHSQLSHEFHHPPRKPTKQEHLKLVTRQAQSDQKDRLNEIEGRMLAKQLKLKFKDTDTLLNKIKKKDLEDQYSSQEPIKQAGLIPLEFISTLKQKLPKKRIIKTSSETNSRNIGETFKLFKKIKDKTLAYKGLVDRVQKGEQREKKMSSMASSVDVKDVEDSIAASNEVIKNTFVNKILIEPQDKLQQEESEMEIEMNSIAESVELEENKDSDVSSNDTEEKTYVYKKLVEPQDTLQQEETEMEIEMESIAKSVELEDNKDSTAASNEIKKYTLVNKILVEPQDKLQQEESEMETEMNSVAESVELEANKDSDVSSSDIEENTYIYKKPVEHQDKLQQEEREMEIETSSIAKGIELGDNTDSDVSNSDVEEKTYIYKTLAEPQHELQDEEREMEIKMSSIANSVEPEDNENSEVLSNDIEENSLSNINSDVCKSPLSRTNI